MLGVVFGTERNVMRLLKTLWAVAGLTACLAQTAVADCSQPSSDQGTATTDTAALTSPTTTHQRNVLLELQVEKSGKVRDAKILLGPTELRPSAINAVSQRKYKFRRPSADLRKITVFVTFAPDSHTVTELTQMSDGNDDTNNAIGMKHAVFGGVSSCVTPGAVKLSQGAAQARLLNRVNPIYPPEAQAQHIEGIVVLQVRIDRSGNVSTAEKISGPELLVPAAIDAVRQWKYQPYVLGGMAIGIDTEVEVQFAPMPEAKDRQTQEDSIREVVFRYLFNHNESGLKNDAAVYCLSLSDERTDPSDQFVMRFKENQPPVLKISKCGWVSNVPIDANTGRRGLVFRITGIRWISGNEAEVAGAYYEGGLSASGDAYRVIHQHGSWKVADCDKKLLPTVGCFSSD